MSSLRLTPAGSRNLATERRRVIHATCSVHGGARSYTNLVVCKENSEIELNPHVDGSCVITLDEQEATALRDALTEWLG